MLDGYQSLFDAEVLTRLYSDGYTLAGKADVGEFAIDLVGESSYNGAAVKDGKLVCAAAQLICDGDASCAIALDVNGSVRRAAAQSGLVAVKPTYGTVSRFGTVPVACSGECVSVMAKSADECYDVLKSVVGHDDKDGTSLSDELCKSALVKGEVKRVALIKEMTEGADSETLAKLDAAVKALEANGVEVTTVEASVIAKARSAWNILMCAELCNNVSRYDGVKYGYRASNFVGIDELYTNSRTEAFGKLLKSAILFGSDTLSTENYMKVYDKALRSRRVITEKFAELFGEFDAVIMPAVSKMAYTEDDVKAD
jgi:aspartyl-tRNA(Asn)/glutamyl-tRNA(Gln) amidotransferase subunit A